MRHKSPYSPQASGKMGGRPLASARPRQRKSIAFVAEAVDTLEALADKASISYADVLHIAILRYSAEKGLLDQGLVDTLKQKAESLASHDLMREIDEALPGHEE